MYSHLNTKCITKLIHTHTTYIYCYFFLFLASLFELVQVGQNHLVDSGGGSNIPTQCLGHWYNDTKNVLTEITEQ